MPGRYFYKKIEALSFVLILLTACFSCSKDEEVRQPADILGDWAIDSRSYLQFNDDNTARTLTIEYQDGESIGKWSYTDVYFYEPGYNMVVYLTSDHEAIVYAVVELSTAQLIWCPVDEIDTEGEESISKIIGNIINKAQEGYELNPELYETFRRVPENQFLTILEGLDEILQPWQYQ